MNDQMGQGALKVIEIIGVSTKSFDDAVQQGVSKAAESISGITTVEVANMSAQVRDGQLTQYRATIRLAFVVR
jgi:flavin-binding protein dodecin